MFFYSNLIQKFRLIAQKQPNSTSAKSLSGLYNNNSTRYFYVNALEYNLTLLIQN